MPTYEFKCDTCGNEDEKYLLIADRDRTFPCVVCGDGTLRRVFAATTAIFCNFEGAAYVTKKANSLNREIVRRQKAKGVGPAVDEARRFKNKIRKEDPPPPARQATAKEIARQMHDVVKSDGIRNKFGPGTMYRHRKPGKKIGPSITKK